MSDIFFKAQLMEDLYIMKAINCKNNKQKKEYWDKAATIKQEVIELYLNKKEQDNEGK